jgi:non-ribosomal peptide synthetase component F
VTSETVTHSQARMYEDAIMAIWRDVLDRSEIGVLDDFFEINGTSLGAIQVAERIREAFGVSIRARDFFESPTIAALAALVAAGSSSGRSAISRRSRDAAPVLSYDQERLWLENQLLPGGAYNLGGQQRLVGPLDTAILEASLRAILIRHEALRTRFPTVDGRPVQVVDDPDENWQLRVEDLGGVTDKRPSTTRDLLHEQALMPFDLAKGPLFRCLLIRLSDTEHILSVTAHHIICDALSMDVFVAELAALYEADGDVDRAGLPALPIQFRDYAVWQRQWLAGEELQRQVDYWRNQLAGAPPALALPAARQGPSRGAPAGRVRAALSAAETSALHELCRRQGVTSFMVLLASLATVLGRWSGQQDLIIGVPISNRTDAGTEPLIGFFVNTVPLRVDLSGNPAFAALLGRVREAALGAYAHDEAPLDLLVKELRVMRDPNRTPLFQVMTTMIESPEARQMRDISAEAVDAPVPPAKMDLTLFTRESRGSLHMELDFNAWRYQAAMMEILAGHVVMLLQAVAEDPNRGILDYSFQAGPEADDISVPAVSWPPAAPYRAVERLAQLPDRTAVTDRDGEWTYRWLSQAADRVAQDLTERIVPDLRQLSVVRRPAATFVAALLGCMKAGAAFSLIEPAAGRAPNPRIATALDAPASAVLDVSPDGESAAGVIDLSSLVNERALTRPGAVAGEQAAAQEWATARFSFGAGDCFAVLSRLPGHLVSALSSAFSAGATLAIPDDSLTGNVNALITWLSANSVSVMYVGPPLLRALAARSARLPALRYVFVDNSGDLLWHDVSALRRLAPDCHFVGLYRVDRHGRPLLMYSVPEDWELQTVAWHVPLGLELDIPVHLAHPSGQAAAVGEVAEICFGSEKTGDLGRRWPDGSVEYVGRLAGRLHCRKEQETK